MALDKAEKILHQIPLIVQGVRVWIQQAKRTLLAFINHAHRGLPKNRLQVLAIIHNYDVRRVDGKTPAQRFSRFIRVSLSKCNGV